LNNLNIIITDYKSSYDVVILLAGPVVVDPTLYSSVDAMFGPGDTEGLPPPTAIAAVDVPDLPPL
jgi:hypothetical protein